MIKILFVCLPLSFYMYIENIIFSNVSHIQGIAFALLKCGAFLAIIFLMMHYFNSLSLVKSKQANIVFVSISISISIFLPILYDFKILFNDHVLIIIYLANVTFITIFWHKLSSSVRETFVLKEKDLKIFYLKYPPQERGDMLMLEISIIFMFLMPIIAKFVR